LIKMDLLKTKISFLRTPRAFTLMEMLTAMVIVGVIAAFGVPNYSKSVDTALSREMINNLRIIKTAQEVYKNGNANLYYMQGVAGPANAAQINTNLGLNLIEQRGITYTCQGTGTNFGWRYDCRAAIAGKTWSYTVGDTGVGPRCMPAATSCPVPMAWN
jgi:prepilin-type N-terminal cleavage/methylation domain-containing protein